MKNSASPVGILAGWGCSFFSRQYLRYGSLDPVFVNWSTLEGIAPALRVKKEVFPMLCSDGRGPELYRLEESSFNIDSLYGFNTLLLFALGLALLAIHQTCVYASLTRIRSTVTHCAGLGSLAGL